MSKDRKQNSYVASIIGGCMKAAAAALFAFLIYLFVHGFAVMDQADFVQSALGTKNRLLAMGIAFGSVCMLFFVAKHFIGLFKERELKVINRVLFLMMVLLQLVFLFYYRSMYLWDGAFVIGGANSLVETGKVAEEAVYYLSVYKNQHPFVVLTAFLLWLGKTLSLESGGQYLLLNVFNMICMDVSVFFLLKCQEYMIRRRTDIEKLRMKTGLLLLIALNPFVYVFVSYYYTITLAMPFFVAGVYYALKLLKGNAKWAVLSGLLFGIGYALRATTIIPAIAFLAAGVCIAVVKKSGKRMLTSITAFLIVIVTGTLICNVSSKIVGIDTRDSAFPTTHWIMMSLTSPGSHNAEDEAFTASFATKEEKKAAVEERLVQKLKDLGVSGYMDLVGDKINYTWESGNHTYSFFTGNSQRTDGIYEQVFGLKKDVLALYGQGFYLFLLLYMCISIIRFLKCKTEEETIIYMGMKFGVLLLLLGGFLFYILWETGTQYSLVFFPFFFLLAADGAFTEDIRTGASQKKKATIFAGAGVLLLAMSLFFMIKNREVFTNKPYVQTKTVMLQLLANTPWEINEGEVLTQSFEAHRGFNKIIFQFRNFILDEENDSEYQVKLYRLSTINEDSPNENLGGADRNEVTQIEEVGKELVFKDKIVAKGQPLNGSFVKQFKGCQRGIYELEICKTSGSEDDNLSFVTYQMGGYDAYPAGDFSINGEKKAQALMLGVYDEGSGSYTSMVRYIAFAIVLFLVFLFLEFCCILIRYGNSEPE